MIVRQRETRARLPNEPTVRFYRTIAFTFLILTVALLGVVVFITSKKATITIVAKEDTKNINLNIGVGPNGNDIDQIKGQISSVEFAWSEKYYPTGTKTIEGVAEGEVKIYNRSDVDQTLIKTTRLLTANGVLYRLKDRVSVPAKGETSARVYADKLGKESDVGPSEFTIPGLPPEKQKLIYAESKEAMRGGSHQIGSLLESDIQSAKTDFEKKIKEAFLKTPEGVKWQGDDKLLMVSLGNIASNEAVGKEVDSFELSGTSTIVMVSYDKNSLENLINKTVSSKIDASVERILSSAGKFSTSLLSYDVKNGTAQISVSKEIVVTLDSDAEKLSARNFLGQDKDTVERNIISLDHVAGVEIEFSPSWINKTPTVPDRIKVIIKNVK